MGGRGIPAGVGPVLGEEKRKRKGNLLLSASRGQLKERGGLREWLNA